MAVTAATGTTFSAAPATTSTATLRTLGGALSAALASAGMVKTTDTGQINWTTVTWVTGLQTWGYEVWRFNDTLQATKPVFVRLVYSQTSSANALQVTAQVGTATDGAGNLTSAAGTGTSVTAAVTICGASTSGAATVSPWYVYGDGSSLVITSVIDKWTGSSSGFGGFFSLERVRHLDGSPLEDAVCVSWSNGTFASVTTQTVMLSTLYGQQASFTGGWFPSQSTMYSSGVVGADMFTVPWFTGFSPRLGAPSTMLVGYYRTDLSVGNTFTCGHYGAARTFIALGGTSLYAWGMTGIAAFSPALRIS
jgi:hypothetical protein